MLTVSVRSRDIALASVMGGLAIALSIARIEFPFPPLTYLKFDLAEIPSFIAYYLAGLKIGVVCALLHFLGMLVRGSNPFGASMKLLAVLSTLVGMALVRKRKIWLELVGGAALRTVIMSIVNLVFLGIFFPGYLEFAMKALRLASFSVASKYEALILTLVLTGLFNTLHAILSVGTAAVLIRSIARRIPGIIERT